MPTDKITKLYNAFVTNGYAMEPEAQFRENLKDPNKRKAAYDALVSDGYDMEPFAEFESNIGYASKPQAAPIPANQSQQNASVNPGSDIPDTSSQEEQLPAQPTQEGWKPTEQEKVRVSHDIRAILNDFNQKSRARLDNARRMTEQFTPEGREKLKAKKGLAQLAGTPTKLMGITQQSGKPEDIPQNDTEGTLQDKPVQSGQSPVPYGVKYVDGKPVTEWLLPDGSVTTSLSEADKAEGSAQKSRLQRQFAERMKQNGLDPSKQEDVQKQSELDMISAVVAPMKESRVIEELWKKAEKAHEADKNANAKENWDKYAALGGGRELRMVSGSLNSHADKVSHITRFDLEKMMDNAWERVGGEMTESCYNFLRKSNPDVSNEELRKTAEDYARQLSDKAIYDYAVEQNAPKSTLEYFGRTIADMNVLNSIGTALARSQAGTSGDHAAYEQAMGEYGKKHRLAQVGGTVVGMAIDPVTWISGGVGSLAGKSALSLGGRFMASRATGMSTQAGARLFGSSLTGRIIAGSAGAAGNLATYEGLWKTQPRMPPETMFI